MWGNKKPDAPQPGQPDQKNSFSNQPSKPAPAAWEDKPAMSTDAMRPLGGTADRGTARLGATPIVRREDNRDGGLCCPCVAVATNPIRTGRVVTARIVHGGAVVTSASRAPRQRGRR